MRPATTAEIHRRTLLTALLAGVLMAAVTGCSNLGFPGVYRINVEQGNIVTAEMIDQLKPGMTRRQVRYILGTPLVEDPFRPDRWEYMYMIRNGDRTLLERRLTVFFEGDSLSRFVNTGPPAGEAEKAGEEGEEEGGEEEAGDAATDSAA